MARYYIDEYSGGKYYPRRRTSLGIWFYINGNGEEKLFRRDVQPARTKGQAKAWIHRRLDREHRFVERHEIEVLREYKWQDNNGGEDGEEAEE